MSSVFTYMLNFGGFILIYICGGAKKAKHEKMTGAQSNSANVTSKYINEKVKKLSFLTRNTSVVKWIRKLGAVDSWPIW